MPKGTALVQEFDALYLLPVSLTFSVSLLEYMRTDQWGSNLLRSYHSRSRISTLTRKSGKRGNNRGKRGGKNDPGATEGDESTNTQSGMR